MVYVEHKGGYSSDSIGAYFAMLSKEQAEQRREELLQDSVERFVAMSRRLGNSPVIENLPD